MASIHRRPGSPFWYAAWRDSRGRLRVRSTKFSTRTKALKLALEFERIDRGLTGGTVAECQAQRILADLIRELGHVPTSAPTIRSWFDGWLEEREGRLAPATAFNYSKAIRSLLGHLGAQADRPLLTLTPALLQSWIDSVAAKGLSRGTARTYTEPIRAALLRAWRRGAIPADPADGLELPRGRAATKDAFTQVEIDRLITEADAEWRVVIHLSSLAGLRLGDACGLRWRDVDLAGGVLRLDQRKTGAQVTIPLHPRLRSALEDRASSDDPEVFITPRLAGAETRGSNGRSGEFRKLMKRAGIGWEERGSGIRKVASKSFHSLRHGFVRALLSAGVDESVRMKLAGHASREAHRVYSQADLALLRKAVEALP